MKQKIDIKIENTILKQVEQFVNLGIALDEQAFQKIKNVLTNKHVSIEARIAFAKTLCRDVKTRFFVKLKMII